MKVIKDMSKYKEDLRKIRMSGYYVQDPQPQNDSGLILAVCLWSLLTILLLCKFIG